MIVLDVSFLAQSVDLPSVVQNAGMFFGIKITCLSVGYLSIIFKFI